MLKAIKINEVEPIVREDHPRKSWILISGKTVGAKNLAMGVNETPPGSMVPAHKHEKEEEVMFFIEGQGKFVTADQEIEIRPGTAIYNPPGETHKIVNTGDTMLKFVWIYSPQLDSHLPS